MLSSTSFNKYRYRRKGKMCFGRCYHKTNFKNRCRRQNEYHIIFNDFKDDQLKMNRFNCGCKIAVINHTVSYNYDTIIDKINYDDMYRTLDMVARHQYY